MNTSNVDPSNVLSRAERTQVRKMVQKVITAKYAACFAAGLRTAAIEKRQTGRMTQTILELDRMAKNG